MRKEPKQYCLDVKLGLCEGGVEMWSGVAHASQGSTDPCVRLESIDMRSLSEFKMAA